MLDVELLKELQPHLMPEEKAIWVGRPTQGLLFTKSYKLVIKLVSYFVMVSLFSNLATFLGFNREGPELSHDAIVLWMICLVILLVTVLGYPWWDADLRKTEFYSVTNLRLLVVQVGKCYSSVLGQLPQLRRMDIENYGDTINFSPITTDSEGTNDGPQFGSCFRFLNGAEDVLEIIVRAQEEIKRTQKA
jgi:hypothetical protein